jgi:hypothetical protein
MKEVTFFITFFYYLIPGEEKCSSVRVIVVQLVPSRMWLEVRVFLVWKIVQQVSSRIWLEIRVFLVWRIVVVGESSWNWN